MSTAPITTPPIAFIKFCPDTFNVFDLISLYFLVCPTTGFSCGPRGVVLDPRPKLFYSRATARTMNRRSHQLQAIVGQHQ
jgi:hypothetical protein